MGFQHCKALAKPPRDGEAPCSPADEDKSIRCFDTASAYELYKTLFGRVEDLIKDKHLLIVPSSSLTQLPFYVLVTEKPEPSASSTTNYGDIKWLVDRQSVAILPSVGSLAVLRRMRPTEAHRALIGFGDPLLDGQPDDPIEALRANEARARQSCDAVGKSGLFGWAGLQNLPLIGSLFRGRFADVDLLRRQMPLPETADELCAVARRLGAPDRDILLGRRMTEAAIKSLSAEGRLRDYRILHFATHGLVAGDLRVAEPALLFSPPASASEIDDGLLTASEIAQLELDADWVVMSACNTAAGASNGAQALSGLARAFFYAGARAVGVALGRKFGRRCRHHDWGIRCSERRPRHRPCRGFTPFDPGLDQPRRGLRTSGDLGAFHPGGRRNMTDENAASANCSRSVFPDGVRSAVLPVTRQRGVIDIMRIALALQGHAARGKGPPLGTMYSLRRKPAAA
jgi:CHAT domain-containing protein